MTPLRRYLVWATLGACAAAGVTEFAGTGPQAAAVERAPFIDLSFFFRSFIPLPEAFLTIAAAGAASAIIPTGLNAQVKHQAVASLLVVLNPVFLSVGVYGAEALFLFAASLIAWRSIFAHANQPNYATTIVLGVALAAACFGSSYLLFTLPALAAGLLILAPWRLTLRGALGVSLAYWAPLVMAYLAYLYAAWIAAGFLPLKAHLDLDWRQIASAWPLILANLLAAPALLSRLIFPQQARNDRLTAAVIIAAIIAGGTLVAGAGSDPFLFAVSAFAAQIALGRGRMSLTDGFSPGGLTAAFLGGAAIAALWALGELAFL